MIVILLPSLWFLFCEGASSPNISGTSYFFKTNGNNEFKVYNRIHYLNHNISDVRYNPHPPSNYKVVTSVPVYREPKKVEGPKTKIYIDEEWDYDQKTYNKSDIPYFITRLYNDRRNGQSNKTNTVRILFNTNANTSSNVIQLDLGSLKSEENITDADLYFYWPLENSTSLFRTLPSVVLKLYQIEPQSSNELNNSHYNNPDIHKLFNIIYISKAQKGWQTFKIKKPLDNWRNGEENLGLLLSVSSYDDSKLLSVHNDSNLGKYRTFAVINIEDNETHTVSTDHQIPINETSLPFLKNIAHECSRKNWFVDFRKLQWDSFIIKPENGFNAFECSGKCHLESKENVNHVKIRIANGNFGYPNKEKSCCVATEMLPLPIMFFDNYGNIVIKSYKEMVVSECGCR